MLGLLDIQRPIERRAAQVQKVGHTLAGFAFVDHFAGVFDLLGREPHSSTELHSPALRGFDSGSGTF